MKINVVGKARLKGIVKRSQKSCAVIQIHYLGFARVVKDKAGLTPSLGPAQYPYDRITVPGDYVVDFDNGGFHMDCRPRHWCMLYHTNPPPHDTRKPRREQALAGGRGTANPPCDFCNMQHSPKPFGFPLIGVSTIWGSTPAGITLRFLPGAFLVRLGFPADAANAGVMDFHGLLRMLGIFRAFRMHHDILDEQPR